MGTHKQLGDRRNPPPSAFPAPPPGSPIAWVNEDVVPQFNVGKGHCQPCLSFCHCYVSLGACPQSGFMLRTDYMGGPEG